MTRACSFPLRSVSCSSSWQLPSFFTISDGNFKCRLNMLASSRIPGSTVGVCSGLEARFFPHPTPPHREPVRLGSVKRPSSVVALTCVVPLFALCGNELRGYLGQSHLPARPLPGDSLELSDIGLEKTTGPLFSGLFDYVETRAIRRFPSYTVL